MEKVVDCMGLACPGPVINAKKAAEAFTEDGVLTVKVDNEVAVQNLSRLAEKKGFAYKTVKNSDADFSVIMQVKAAGAASSDEESDEEIVACSDAGVKRAKERVVVIGTDKMGVGDDALGKKLINAFIYALTSQDIVPDKIIFYNGGVHLTTEGSDVLEDLKVLEDAGAVIMSCGTCLDFYGLKDKLKVGIISNMYDIVEAQMSADTIIKP